MKIRVLSILQQTMADGPGFRTAIYCAGCAHHCPGCHNPESWDFAAGEWMEVDDLVQLVKEDGMSLFGFADTTEKNLFLMLLDVNGVGPKLAQRILSGSTPADLLNMIASDNKAALGKIKGLGKKTCEQMTLTLKEKASNMLQALGDVEGSGITSVGALTGAKMEAVLALHTLGVKDPTAEKAVVKAVEVLGDGADAAALIPEALKYL